MSFEKDDVTAVAKLARLTIEEADIPQYQADLSRILGMVDELKALDTSAVAPMAHPLDTHQRLRADEVTESNQRDHFQSNSPATEDGLFLVPRVIE